MKPQFKNNGELLSLRDTLARYPTGVAIVTALADNFQPIGMTINSFSSVSLTPPLISWCIDHRSTSHEAFVKAGKFTITVLAESQTELAKRFATQGANKFRGIEIVGNEAPIIPNGCAWFKCETYRSILLGDHTMVAGQVIEFGKSLKQPLFFNDGQFQQLAQNAGEASPRAAA